MQFALTADHHQYFSKNHFIEFEDLFSSAEISTLKTHIEACLKDQDLAQLQTPLDFINNGRNFWKKDPVIKKMLFSRRLGQTASLLFYQKKLRMGFDQLLKTKSVTGSPLEAPSSLKKISSFQPVFCGVILRLTDDPSPAPFTPQKVGNALFIHPDLSIPWNHFFQNTEQSFLLIAYVHEKAQYVIEPSDPHKNEPKKRGYSYGDFLSQDAHPFVFRR